MRRSPICKCGHHYSQHVYVSNADTDPCETCDCVRFDSVGRIEIEGS